MWRASYADGTLVHSFLDSLIAIKRWYVVRALGGCFIRAGMGVMAWNMWHTSAEARKGNVAPIPVPLDDGTGHIANSQAAGAY